MIKRELVGIVGNQLAQLSSIISSIISRSLLDEMSLCVVPKLVGNGQQLLNLSVALYCLSVLLDCLTVGPAAGDFV